MRALCRRRHNTQQARNVSWELNQLGVHARFFDPRSRRQVRRWLRPRVPGRRHGRDQDSDRGAKGKFTRGAANWIDQARISGLASDSSIVGTLSAS